jgi:two-component system, sensor histidine kinase and response regulator
VIEQFELSEAGTKILVVDDNPLILNVLEGLFSSIDYEVLSASSGTDALSLLEDNQVEVIVCDVMMPDMDGYTLQGVIRERTDLANIPFVFLTALGTSEQVRQGRESGADDYLIKPFDPEHLLSLVKGKVRRARQLKTSNQGQYEQYRKRILRTLSHEFRTPLVAINAGTELLLERSEGIDEQKTNKLLEAIRRGGQRLERLVNDFMLLQQIDSGVAAKMFEKKSALRDLNAVIRSSLELETSVVTAGGMELKTRLSDQPLFATMFDVQIADIISRLLSNAVKFSNGAKQIEVTSGLKEGRVILAIRDYGAGISMEYVKEAMKPFGQLDRERMEQQGGGLGLAIAQHYTLLHSGLLTFERPEGGGTRVLLSLPASEDEGLSATL